MNTPRRSSRRKGRAAAAALIIAIGCVACTPWARTGSRDLLPEKDAPPARLVPRSASPRPAGGPATPTRTNHPTGTMAVFVYDTASRLRPEVLIEYSGPRDGSMTTGKDGSARAKVPVGRYALRIPHGCQPALEVRQERIHPEVVVYEDRVSTVRFTALDARRRFWPSTPVQWSADPPWDTGATITLSFLMIDRCTGDTSPAGTSFDALRYRPNAFVTLVGTPVKRTAAGGRATVSFACTRAGAGALELLDPDTGKRIELLSMRPPFAPVDELCG